MAKRKRLTPPNPSYLEDAQDQPRPGMGTRVPIADVASDAAATAALRDVSAQMMQARQSGRMVAEIPLAQIQMDYLVRDRIAGEDADMAALMSSIRDRGQQTPIEVVELGQDRYGLISGWRRCQALQQLADAGDSPAQVLAFLRQPATASDAYLAMIEENEIRVGLSYFERARIVVKAVQQGVFETQKQALKSLFGTASRAKRSKIGSFVTIVEAMDEALLYPQAIGERLGLQLAKALATDPGFAQEVIKALRDQPRPTPQAEEAVLRQVLSGAAGGGKTGSNKDKPASRTERELRPGVMVRVAKDTGKIEIWGKAMTPELRGRLLTWLQRQT